MKKFISRILMVAVIAAAALSTSSCKKMKPSQIDTERYAYRATFVFTVKLSTEGGETAVKEGTTVELICDGVHYTEKTDKAGKVTKTVGCTSSGASMTANCFVGTATGGKFGTASTSASSSNGFHGSATVLVK